MDVGRISSQWLLPRSWWPGYNPVDGAAIRGSPDGSGVRRSRRTALGQGPVGMVEVVSPGYHDRRGVTTFNPPPHRGLETLRTPMMLLARRLSQLASGRGPRHLDDDVHSLNARSTASRFARSARKKRSSGIDGATSFGAVPMAVCAAPVHTGRSRPPAQVAVDHSRYQAVDSGDENFFATWAPFSLSALIYAGGVSRRRARRCMEGPVALAVSMP